MAKKNKNTPAVVAVSYAPSLFVSADANSNNLSWSFGTPPAGNIIKWTMVNRRYTNPQGQTLTYLGQDWSIIATFYQAQWYSSGQGYITTYTESALIPYDTQDLPTGTYEYQLRGSYGQVGSSLYDKPYLSNIISLVVT